MKFDHYLILAVMLVLLKMHIYPLFFAVLWYHAVFRRQARSKNL